MRKRGKGPEKSKRKGKKAKEAEEKEAEESGEEEEEESGWDRSEAERKDKLLANNNEDVNQLESSSELPFSAKPSMRYQQIVAVGRAGAPAP
jgi:hypothetical protein